MKRSDIEIMAPVGSFESLMAAIQAGADAVYFGLEKLNMRARASANFSINDLKEIVQRCEKHNVKTYLALNVILYDHELGDMRALLQTAKSNNISAVIAADQAVLNQARALNLEVHLSTQLNISNLETLRFYAGYADVMVLARELNLNQVKDITNGIKNNNIKGPSGNLISVEMFAHGALCMSVSGKCYLSLHEQNYSANRGACLQHCRKGYTVREKESGRELDIENEYMMSPKDLKTIHFLNKIIDAGVTVLKIEGRARGPEYVYTVVTCYNQALESLEQGTYNAQKIAEWDQKLASVFNRGFWDGYYLGQKLGEWSHVYGSQATERKIYVGKGRNYFDRIGVAEFECQAAELSVGDKIIIVGPVTGYIECYVNEIRVKQKPINKVKQGDIFSIPLSKRIRSSDKMYKTEFRKTIDLQN
ncbi:MAG: U32 family peptidase [Bacteroidetes bacterium]|nr:U32 family peptidase [Bacteroidota bacterium]